MEPERTEVCRLRAVWESVGAESDVQPGAGCRVTKIYFRYASVVLAPPVAFRAPQPFALLRKMVESGGEGQSPGAFKPASFP